MEGIELSDLLFVVFLVVGLVIISKLSEKIGEYREWTRLVHRAEKLGISAQMRLCLFGKDTDPDK